MDVDDRVVLTTPEGVTIDLVLAGLGSRFAAALLDVVIRTAVIIAVAILGGLIGEVRGGWAVAFATIFIFFITFGYDLLFEVLANGRTLGKRWTGIRVVDRNGGPVRFVASAVRNLLRIIDILPGFYLLGTIVLLVTKRNQRLGDLAAGTFVIRERRTPRPSAWAAPVVDDGVELWDVASVTAEEIATIRRFLERRTELLPIARGRLAGDLAARLRPKVGGADEHLLNEAFLEQVVAARSISRGGVG